MVINYNIVQDPVLLDLLYNNFKNNDALLYELCFNIYKQSFSTNIFIVDLNIIYKHLGNISKHYIIKLLSKYFIENIDFIIHDKDNFFEEIIFLSIECFKKLCIKLGTYDSNRLYDYYNWIENIVLHYLQNKLNDLEERVYIQNEILETNKVKISNLTNSLYKNNLKKYCCI
jgi:hypothetical protein